MLRVLTSFRRNPNSCPCHAERSGIVRRTIPRSRSIPAFAARPLPLCHPERSVSVRRTVTRSRGTPMPVDIQQRPVRESSEISARRPTFRVLCGSTNPTLRSIPTCAPRRSARGPHPNVAGNSPIPTSRLFCVVRVGILTLHRSQLQFRKAPRFAACQR
jgi:hypothetical protein